MEQLENLQPWALQLYPALVLAPLRHSRAEKVVHTTKFNVNFSGIRIGKVTFTIEIDGEEYDLKASGKTDGVARLFSSGKGNFNSQGRFDGDNVIATSHAVQVVEKGKTAKLSMAFDNGNLVDVSANPKKKSRKGKSYIQILPDHLKAIMRSGQFDCCAD